MFYFVSATTPKTVVETIKPVKVKPLPEAENPGYNIHGDSEEDIDNVIVSTGPGESHIYIC